MVINLFEADLDTFASKEDHVAYVADVLNSSINWEVIQIDHRAYCSLLISKVYTIHIQKTSTEYTQYGPQKGALALVTVVVCHNSITNFDWWP